MTTAPAIAKARQRAMRFANRGAACKSEPDKRATWRQTVNALMSTLPPCRDGHHPLDADRLKLEGE